MEHPVCIYVSTSLCMCVCIWGWRVGGSEWDSLLPTSLDYTLDFTLNRYPNERLDYRQLLLIVTNETSLSGISNVQRCYQILHFYLFFLLLCIIIFFFSLFFILLQSMMCSLLRTALLHHDIAINCERYVRSEEGKKKIGEKNVWGI